jgi:hypothetical protein
VRCYRIVDYGLIVPAIAISFECSKVVWGLRMAQRGLSLSDRRTTRVLLRFVKGFVLGCFFDLAFVTFVGCVWISHYPVRKG